MNTTRKPVARLLVLNDALPYTTESAESGFSNQLGFLEESDSEFMTRRIGQEVRVARRPVDHRVIDVTRGASCPFPEGGNVAAGRYLMREQRAGGRITGAINYMLLAKTAGRQQAVVSNIVVAQGFRRQGLATRLLDELVDDHPGARVDSKITADGAAFFGYSPGHSSCPNEAQYASRP